MRDSGWYRVKFRGEWKCVEWKDPCERRGGWQFGDRMDPQPWFDVDFDEIGDRVTMPDELPKPDEFYEVRNTQKPCGRPFAPRLGFVLRGETDMGYDEPSEH